MHDTRLSAKSLSSTEETPIELKPFHSLDRFRRSILGMRTWHARARVVLSLFRLSRMSSEAARPNRNSLNHPRSRNRDHIALLYGQLLFRRLLKTWQRARNRRKQWHAVLDMDERLMNDIGLPPEHIKAVLRRRSTATDRSFW